MCIQQSAIQIHLPSSKKQNKANTHGIYTEFPTTKLAMEQKVNW